jgi:putative endonuclease
MRSFFFPATSVWIRGENDAAKLMKSKGLKVLARNLRLGAGEIDILCFDPDSNCVVVVEVKARIRKSDSTPAPESSITAAKKRKLRTLAKLIMKRDDCIGKKIRIDVVAVEYTKIQRRASDIRHYESAVGAA